MYEFISNFYPRNARKNFEKLLAYSNVKVRAERFIGFILFFLFIEVVVYLLMLLRADAKARFIESILPDALRLMASNLRAGLTVDKALFLASRPEFGPFQDEVSRVGKDVAMGRDLGESLVEMSNRVRSKKLEKTFFLISAGLKSGGELSELLEQTARNLREQGFVSEKIKANVMMYVIFIFAAVSFGSPLLFGLSSFLVMVITKSLGSVSIPETAAQQLPISFTEISIEPRFILVYAVVFLITTSIMASLVIGLINKGKEREGLKFMPILIILTLTIFFLVRAAMKGLFGGLFGF